MLWDGPRAATEEVGVTPTSLIESRTAWRMKSIRMVRCRLPMWMFFAVAFAKSEFPNEAGESHRAGALLQTADLRSCINARAKSGNRHKKRKCGNDHLSGGRKGAAAMTERFLYVNRVLLLVVSMRRVRKSRTHISLMKYFRLQADKTFLMTLMKFRNKN